MKIILANRYFYPDQSATSRIVSSLAFALADRGYSVTALASRHVQDRHGISLPAREMINGVEVHRPWISGFGSKGLAGRTTAYATYHVSALGWLLRHAEVDDLCVICTNPPLLSVTLAAPIALRRAKMVNWVMDLFPEASAELGLVRKGGILDKLVTALRDVSLRAADLTICPMQATRNHLAQRGVDSEKLVTVHHWTDENEIRPVLPADNALRREWSLEDAFVVGYSGTFGRARELSTLLDAAERLSEYEDIRFLIIGDGQQRGLTAMQARRRSLSNVIFKPCQPSERLAESLSVADVHIVSLLPTLEYCIAPSKLHGILAAGRPTIFIGDEQGEIATAAKGADCGEAVAPGDGEALAARIMRLRDSPPRRLWMGSNARRLMEREYTQRHGVDQWLDAVSDLLSCEAPAPFEPLPGRVAL